MHAPHDRCRPTAAAGLARPPAARLPVALLALGLLAGLTAPEGAEARRRKESRRDRVAVERPDRAPPSPEAPEHPQLRGPKPTIAVLRFATKSDFEDAYGTADVGGGLSALLTTALVETGRFVVVERATLSDVLAEQDLASGGLTNAESGAPAGRLLGASVLIQGSVTTFSEEAARRSDGIGLGGPLRFGLSTRSRTGSVGFDVRAVDAVTGQVLASFAVEESVKERGRALEVGARGLDLEHDSAARTVLGKAARQAIETAADRLAAELASVPWSGRVVAFDGRELVINAGADAGLRPGDRFQVQDLGDPLTDPVTGRTLGHRTVLLGVVEVLRVDHHLAFGRFRPATDLTPQRGDLVARL